MEGKAGNRQLPNKSEVEEEGETVYVERLSDAELVEYARYGEVEILRELVALGQATRLASAVDDRGNTMLHMFAANGHLDCIRFLLQHIVVSPLELVNRQNSEGNTALHWACISGQLTAAQLLLIHGATVAIENKLERTPVCEAHRHRRSDMLEFFEDFLGKKSSSPPTTANDVDGDDSLNAMSSQLESQKL